MLVSCQNQKTEWKGTIEEVNGVTVVNNPKEPMYCEDVFSLEKDLALEKNEVGIRYFKRIGEIKEGFSEEESNYFWKIGDLCCDDENNIYVVDVGWNKIFKFDSKNRFIASFGREGQGPGEFSANSRQHNLRISFGNDGYIYITDPGNQRLSIFSKKGEFIKSFPLSVLLYDRAQVNSKGDIYLISKSGEKVIDCYDKNFQVSESFLDEKSHFKYPVYEPKFKLPPDNKIKSITEYGLNKVITKKDHLIVFSNFSLTVFHFDHKNELVDEFLINNEIFLGDFKKRLKSAIERGGFISPLRMFLDSKGKLCFLYWNSSIQHKWEIYRYEIDGTFLDIIRFPEKIGPRIYADGIGNFYAVMPEETKIGIYRIE